MIMLMKHNQSGKFVKVDAEYSKRDADRPFILRGDHPWLLVDNPNEATNDPAFIAGEDFTMTMMVCLPDSSYSCLTLEEALNGSKGE